MSIIQIAENVFSANSDPFILSNEHLKSVVDCALHHPLQRARINLHSTDDSTVHEMIIALTDKSTVHPHKHPDKSESFHILRGELKISFFDDQGFQQSDLDVILSASSGPLVYRLNSPLFHSVESLTRVSLFHETTSGPFIPGLSSVYPSWDPRKS